jgi:hypothetical protein
MSSTVYIDNRARDLRMAESLINAAISNLQAQKSQIACGHADVVKSSLDVGTPASEIQKARYQDRLDVKNTGDLETKLKAKAPDYSAESLEDWKPVVGDHAGTVHIEDGKVDSHTNMRLVEDLESAALDGARIMIFEVDDGLGNKSYTIGLEDILFDEKGDWKNTKAKAAYENFLTKAIAAQQVAMEDEKAKFGETNQKLRSAFKAAGLDAKKTERLPTGATHTVFTDRGSQEERATLSSFKVGAKS